MKLPCRAHAHARGGRHFTVYFAPGRDFSQLQLKNPKTLRAGPAPVRAVVDIQRLGLFPAVFAPPPALQAALGGGFGAPCAAVMAAADALLRAWAPQVRRAHRRHAPAAPILPSASATCQFTAPSSSQA